MTPLIAAVRMERLESVKTLVELGADVNAKDQVRMGKGPGA